jgi:putative membrane protein
MHGMAAGREPAVTISNLVTHWQGGVFAFCVAAAVVGAAAWYLRAAAGLRARGRRWPWWRTVSFLAGLLCVELALGSAVAVYAGYTFTSHIFQHLLLMVAAPPLGALGAPMTLLLQTSGRSTKRRVLAVLHSRAFAVISHPVPVFFFYYLSMYAFFLTAALGYAMDHMWLMDLINLGFLAGATLFWWPMVGIDPVPRGRMNGGFKIINLLIGVPVESFLGIALLSKRAPVAPMYSLVTTHVGGGVLWAATEIVTIFAVGPVFFEWMRSDARLAKRIDARIDAGEDVSTPAPSGVGMAATFRSLRRS